MEPCHTANDCFVIRKIPVTVEFYMRVLKECYLEPGLKEAKAFESFQFVRNGYFCVDCRDSEPGKPVFNRIVSLKSSFKLPK